MPDLLLYLHAIVATGISAVVVTLAIGKKRTPGGTSRNQAACILATAVGLMVGYGVLEFQPNWPPTNGLDRFLTILVPAVIVIEILAIVARVPSWFAWLLRIVLGAISGRVLLHGSVYLNPDMGEWTAIQAWAVLALSGVLLIAEWLLLSELARRSEGRSITLTLSFATLAAGIAIMLAGYIKGGAATLPLATACIATTIGSCFRAGSTRMQPIIGIAIIGLFGLTGIGRFFGQLSMVDALTVVLAPLLCWVTEIRPLLRPLHGRPTWVIGLLRLVFVGIPLVVILIMAKQTFDREMAPLLGML